MSHWLFHRITGSDGSGWRWQCKDDEGKMLDAAQQLYAAYPDCLADAMRHGYLSDVKTCGDVELER